MIEVREFAIQVDIQIGKADTDSNSLSIGGQEHTDVVQALTSRAARLEIVEVQIEEENRAYQDDPGARGTGGCPVARRKGRGERDQRECPDGKPGSGAPEKAGGGEGKGDCADADKAGAGQKGGGR